MSNDQFYDRIALTGLIQDRDRIVVAVSGGPDSMGLLHALLEYRNRNQKDIALYAAHVNHHTRPGENEAESALVQRFCEQAGVPFRLFHYYFNGEENFQDEARRFRYEVFKRYAREVGANKIALAHHLDDQAETVLFKLLRGSNFIGYSGMKAQTTVGEELTIIRPLLGVTKETIIAYCDEYSVPYVLDPSNASTQYTRNKLRHWIIPKLKEIQPDAVMKMEQFRIQLEEVGYFLDEMATDHFDRLVTRSPESLSLPVRELLGLPLAIVRLVLTKAINALTDEVELSFIKQNALIDNLRNPKPNITMDLGQGYEAVKAYDTLLFRKKKEIRPYLMALDAFKQYELPNGTILTVKKVKEKLKINRNRLILCYNNSMWPLFVRSPKPGDRIKTKVGHKKLNRIFINAKIPKYQRDVWPVVTDQEDRILWVVGLEKSVDLPSDDDEHYIVIEVN